MSSTSVRKEARSVNSAVMESARSSGTPALSSVESSWVKNRTSRFRPPENDGSLMSTDCLGFPADIDRREPLAAQLEGDQPLGLGVNGAGANLPVGGDGSEVKVSHAVAPEIQPRMNADER